MLQTLIIHDVVLIDKLAVTFDDGLNVLTGETGAGKSILLDALSLALGARSDAGLIRAGAPQASVTASFSGPLPEPLAALLQEQGLVAEDPLTLRRVVQHDGRSRAFLCDQPIGVSLLRQIGQTLIEIHGQFDTHGLLNPASHRAILDLSGGPALARAKQQVASAFDEWSRAREAHMSAKAKHKQAVDEEEFLRACLKEFDTLCPQTGETETLAAQRQRLQHREKIAEGLAAATDALDGEKGAIAQLAHAGKSLSKIADKAPALAAFLAIVDRASAEAADASAQLARFAAEHEADETSLERIEERLFALRALARKHGRNPDDLASVHEELRQQLALLTDQGGALAALGKAENAARAAYVKEAQALSALRARAADTLSKDIGKELPPLKLERARFAASLQNIEKEEEWGPCGVERVTFEASANAGHALAPLHKVASGGELARFMLAIKVVLAKADPVPTLVFDEVDAGIGGATAAAVGERLAQLGRSVQVLVVTHSPQVAALGQLHLKVSKNDKGKVPTTRIAPLTDEERAEEIARMLSGQTVTPAARAAAQDLLGQGAVK